MYKVTYYAFSGSRVMFRHFDTFNEACEFARTVKNGDVIEIKLYPKEDNKKENRT